MNHQQQQSSTSTSTGPGCYYYYCQSIDRSNEFLSCAKTAIKVAKSQYIKKIKLQYDDNFDEKAFVADDNNITKDNEWFLRIDPNYLSLYDNNNISNQSSSSSLIKTSTNKTTQNIYDAYDGLNTIEQYLIELETLVRRRGQTNDPTNEISTLIEQFQKVASQLTVVIQTQIVPIRVYGQKAEHYKQIQQWFLQQSQYHDKRLKEILALRASVVTEQMKRRKRFLPSSTSTTTTTSASSSETKNLSSTTAASTTTQQQSTIATAQAYYQSQNPLFAVTPVAPIIPPVPAVASPANENGYTTTTPNTAAAPQPIATTVSAVVPPNGSTTSSTEITSFPAISNTDKETNHHITTNNTNPYSIQSKPNGTTTTTTSVRNGSYSTPSTTARVGGYGTSATTTPTTNGYYGTSTGVTVTRSNVGYGGMSYSNNNAAVYNGIGHTTTSGGIRHRGARGGGGSWSVSSSGGGGAYAHQIQQNQNQQLLQMQQVDRTQSLARAKEARQVEKSLAEIGSVFGKMSTLLVQQGETITKIEDDVEAAHYDVSAGQNEITILYQLKKGNRMLIIKTFALLIFLIIFMRFYAR